MGLSPSELEMSSEEMGELLDVSTLAIFATWFLFRFFWCCVYYGNGSLVGFYSHLFLYSPFLFPIRFLLFRYISTFFLFRLFLLRFILSLAFEDTCTFAVANAIECLSDILLHVNPFWGPDVGLGLGRFNGVDTFQVGSLSYQLLPLFSAFPCFSAI